MDNKYGWMQATFQAPCDLSAEKPNKLWITKLLRQNPDLTGWPFFVDLWTPRDPGFSPKIRDGVWEARIVRSEGDNDFQKIDHWRIDAKQGLFYVARALEDDTSSRNPNCGNTLDYVLAIVRTAEILAIAVRFSNYLCKENLNTNPKVSLSFEWSGLKGRVLSSWTNPARKLSEENVCHTDTVSKFIEVPLAATHDQIVLFTQEIVEDLFLNFDGFECSASVVQDLVSKLLKRKF